MFVYRGIEISLKIEKKHFFQILIGGSSTLHSSEILIYMSGADKSTSDDDETFFNANLFVNEEYEPYIYLMTTWAHVVFIFRYKLKHFKFENLEQSVLCSTSAMVRTS